MNRLVYPARAIWGDYARAATGIVFTLGPALAIGQWSWAHALLLPLALLFAVFAFRTWRRRAVEVGWDDTGLSISGTERASLPWDRVATMKLAFYATTRDRTGGWMQLTLKGGGTTVRADSGAENFQALAVRCADVARARQLPLDASTRANFAALDIRLPEESA
jgi:hypothetical protein